MGKRISVIVPVYNTASYLEKCLDSILHNTYNDLEILCVDDGSTDGSGMILDRYAEENERVTVFHQINCGVSSARNTGLKAATGEYIAFIDSDDYIHPQFFSCLFRTAQVFNADIVYGDIQSDRICNDLLIEENIPAEIIPIQQVLSDHTLRAYVTGRLINRRLISSIRFEKSLSLAEDRAFNYELFSHNQDITIVKVNAILYCYCRRTDSALMGEDYSSGERVKVTEDLIRKYNSVHDSFSTKLYLDAIVKHVLFSKYELGIRGIHSFDDDFKRLGKECLRYLRSDKVFSAKRTAAYTAMLTFPRLYRAYRIHGDKTLLEHEREMKTKYNK